MFIIIITITITTITTVITNRKVGTTMTWLILDITFYGTGSFKSRISPFLGCCSDYQCHY